MFRLDCLQVPEAEGDDQFEMEKGRVGSYEDKESESVGSCEGKFEHFDSVLAEGKVQGGLPQIEMKSESASFEETQRRRGKDSDWQQVERFDSPQAFNRSQIKAELDTQMYLNRAWRSSGARQEHYRCKVSRKRAWKPCLRKYKVSLHYRCR